jgi:sugar phosphate isomerase/epimerase
MRVAVSTVAFPGVALADLPQAAQAVGAEGIALGVAPDGPMSPEASATVVSDFRHQCRDRGLEVSATYGYAGRRLLLDPQAATTDVALAKRCIDLAAGLGAPVCRLFAGTKAGTDEVIDRFIEACLPIAVHAAGAGVRLGFPTHHDLAFDPRSCRRLIQGIGPERAGIIFTGPNLELDGISPIPALSEMADLVVQVEIKDWIRHDGTAHPAPIGAGDAIVWPIVEALVGFNFGGWITLHHLRQHHPELQDLDPAVSARVRQIISRENRHDDQ